MKLVRPWYTLAFVLLALVYLFNNNRPDPMDWLILLPLPIFLVAIFRHIRQRSTVLIIGGGKLRYQSGIFSKDTRLVDLSKIQDVRVAQSLAERMLGLGTITLETAADNGGLQIENLDRPQVVADYILDAAGR